MRRRRGRSYVAGARKLRRTLQRLPKDITTEVVEVMGDYARGIQKTAIEMVPVDQGDTKEAVESARFVGRKSNGFGWEVGFRTKKLKRLGWKAHFIEFGTKGFDGVAKVKVGPRAGTQYHLKIPPMRAQPFLVPSMQANKMTFRPRLRRAINRALKRGVGRR